MPASPTPAQSATSRANGARSRGPTTPEAKARSALNGLPPGARLAHMRFLDGEDPLLLENLRRRQLRALVPEDETELDAVEDMVRARHHLVRLDRLLDLQVAGKSPQAFLHAALASRWGQDGMEYLGRWREREERSLDRAHRCFLRQRQANRKGLVVGADEPADLPLPANGNARDAEPALAPGESGGGAEPGAAAPAAAEDAVRTRDAVMPQGVAGEFAAAPAAPAAAGTARGAEAAGPTAQEVAGEPERPRPAAAPEPRAEAEDPRALYGAILQERRPAAIEARLRALGRPQRHALLKVIRGQGPLARQPVQALWALRALVPR
jgi:hypothetical protein